MIRKLSRVLALAALVAAGAPGAALAQDAYPSKPIRLIVPFPPGTGVDVVARKAGLELAPRMGQQWVIDNRPGGNFVIGGDVCAKAPADGYTLCVVSQDTMSVNPFIFAKLPYDPERDLRGITLLYYITEGIFVKVSLPVASVKELQSYAASRAGALNFGTLGPDSLTDIFMQWMNSYWKTRFAGIPYKGGNLIISALAAEEIDVARIGVYNAIGLLKAGKVKLLAIGSAKRSPLLPNVPTVAEVGLVGFPGVRPWLGLAAPAAVADPIIRRINAEFVRLFREREFADFLDSYYVESEVGTPEEFAAFLRKDREIGAQMVKTFNVKQQ